MIPTSARQSQIQPWCVIRQLPKMQRIVVARFQRESDADGYLRVLRRLLPTSNHVVVYDPGDLTTVDPSRCETLKESAL